MRRQDRSTQPEAGMKNCTSPRSRAGVLTHELEASMNGLLLEQETSLPALANLLGSFPQVMSRCQTRRRNPYGAQKGHAVAAPIHVLAE